MIPNYILFEADITNIIDNFISNNKVSKVFILVDENTEKHCLPLLKLNTPYQLIQIKSGESNKTLDTCVTIWDSLTKANADRKALLLNLGGGVIGDMGGFCASTYKRGIKFMNIPTTLLSQVDASIGGKLGIDFKGLKNHIGLFQNPDMVIINNQFLDTLPERQLLSGFAEVVKHALISNREWWEMLKNTNPHNIDNWNEITRTAVGIKGEVVNADPTEKGLRKILNFGHTIGHAIESWFLEKHGDDSCLHGEAIAAGMIAEAFLSIKHTNLSENEFEEINDYILSHFPLISIPEDAVDEIAKNCLHDKKNNSDKISFVLLHGIGKSTYDHEIELNEIKIAIEKYMQITTLYSDQTPKS
ncbi:3-dehydroquinate synthase [Marinigracilibium pacificum]|uniref:3-dehydroquinate synthase n=1 Tax=Marinigracilibium pacificum TaxID=2729599 RepID=A0A848J1K6_9BACT|nr:3-dehydroquinate synthase [Marinigracilibium pacificum]NMM49395.1 3-dehydroquinate synthase [Marinigracilibium pacificum]